MDFVAHLLFYCVEIKDKPRECLLRRNESTCSVNLRPFVEQHGLCRAISYIFQTLSAESAFGVRMTTPMKVQLPTKWGPVDTAADFIIHVGFNFLKSNSMR